MHTDGSVLDISLILCLRYTDCDLSVGVQRGRKDRTLNFVVSDWASARYGKDCNRRELPSATVSAYRCRESKVRRFGNLESHRSER